MGALASAEFVKSIYESAPGPSEQDSPIVALYSDPTFPDRMECLLRNETEELLGRLLNAVARLRDMGASRTVICCMTIHHLLPSLPRDVRNHLISLLDVIFAQVDQRHDRHLLICSSGARVLRLFQGHPQWNDAENRILFPDDDDQAQIHGLIYQIKENRGVAAMGSLIETLVAKYRVDSFIAGCSEMHIVAKQMRRDGGRPNAIGCVDPFAIIAREWAAGRRDIQAQKM